MQGGGAWRGTYRDMAKITGIECIGNSDPLGRRKRQLRNRDRPESTNWLGSYREPDADY